MKESSGQRVHKAVDGAIPESIPCIPMMMRYAAARQGVGLKEYFLDGRLFAECHIRTAEEFDLDGILLASEPTRVVQDLGGRVSHPEDGIPHLESPLVSAPGDLERLTVPDLYAGNGRMRDLLQAAEVLVEHYRGRRSICGWADAPFAEACNIMTVPQMMMKMTDDAALTHKLLEFTTDLVIEFLKAQAEVGVDMVGIGDAAASLISPAMYREFAWPYEKAVIEAMHGIGIPVKLHMCGANDSKLSLIVETGVDILNVDQNTNIHAARRLAPQLCLKGNLDPVSIMKNADPDDVYAAAVKLIKEVGPGKYILSGGCELVPETPAENLKALVAAGRETAWGL